MAVIAQSATQRTSLSSMLQIHAGTPCEIFGNETNVLDLGEFPARVMILASGDTRADKLAVFANLGTQILRAVIEKFKQIGDYPHELEVGNEGRLFATCADCHNGSINCPTCDDDGVLPLEKIVAWVKDVPF